MSFWEMLGLVVSGAGTFASVLGVFFGLYARQNGRATREFIAAQNRDMREFIAAQNRDAKELITATQELSATQTRDMREFIAAQNQDMREFLATVLERLTDRISQEGEKTREEIRQLHRSAG